MIQGRLGSLIGRSSGYVESLPAPVRRRVAGLKGIQKEHAKLEAQFQEEVLQLEKKYFQKFTPLYERRSTIVNGAAEPTEAEIEAGKGEEEDQDIEEKKPETEGGDEETKMTGVPEFWLSAMKNQVSLAEMITDRDEEALRHLTDIRMEYLDRPGFRLIFEFSENEFFTNKTLSKTYFYQEESGYGGDFIYDHAEGDKIDWKADKDLTVRIDSKKQRNRSKHLKLGITAIYIYIYKILTTQTQVPSKPAWSKSLCQLNHFSISFLLPSPLSRMMRQLQVILKNGWNLTTSLARISKRS